MGGMQTTVQGAGQLKGSEFLLFSDWKTLADRPDFDLYEQTNKARDILIRTTVILQRRKRSEKEQSRLDDLWNELAALLNTHYNFSSIEGSTGWRNEYWAKLSHLLFGLYELQAEYLIIESEGTEDLKAPFSTKGDG